MPCAMAISSMTTTSARTAKNGAARLQLIMPIPPIHSGPSCNFERRHPLSRDDQSDDENDCCGSIWSPTRETIEIRLARCQRLCSPRREQPYRHQHEREADAECGDHHDAKRVS